MSVYIPERRAVMTGGEFPPLETILAEWLTTTEAAQVIERNNDRSITTSGVRDLCARGTLRARQISSQWYIDPVAVGSYRSSGRGPRKK